jgi:ribose transport system permease protein
MPEKKTVVERIYGFRIVMLIVVLLATFSLASKNFFSLRTVEKTLLLLPSDGVVAVGVTLVMIVGELDVSVGGVLSVSGLILVKLLPLGLWAAVLAALAAGAAIGFINGYVVNRLKVNSLITTVAMGFVLSGVSFLLAGQSVGYKNETLTGFGNVSLWVFPVSTLFYFFVTALIQLTLKITPFGLKLYAVGGSRTSSAYSGIDVRRMGIGIFVLCSFFAALGGVLYSARLATASPTFGGDTAIFVITAVLLGGTTLGGGNGDVVRTLLGVILLSLLTKGFTQLQVPAYYQNMVIGAILILLLFAGAKLSQKSG